MPTASASPSTPALTCTCWNCQGTGTVRAVLPSPPPAERYVVTQHCAVCHGSGRRTMSFQEAQRRQTLTQHLHGQHPLNRRTP